MAKTMPAPMIRLPMRPMDVSISGLIQLGMMRHRKAMTLNSEVLSTFFRTREEVMLFFFSDMLEVFSAYKTYDNLDCALWQC